MIMMSDRCSLRFSAQGPALAKYDQRSKKYVGFETVRKDYTTQSFNNAILNFFTIFIKHIPLLNWYIFLEFFFAWFRLLK